MNLVNVAIENLGAKIKTYSSFIDNLHQPQNILQSTQDSLWATTQGLPQFVIVSLENMNVNFRNIEEVGFMLWHDYDTNPKSIEMWVAQTTDQQFVFWADFLLDQKKGIQLFQIQPLPKKFIYLKISITETYGAYETYLNQIFLMADEVTPLRKTTTEKDIMKKTHKQLDLQDLQSNLNQLIQMDIKITRSKSKNNKKNKQKILNKNIRQSDLSDRNARMKRQTKNYKNASSKGSLSSNRPGLSIYYRQSDNLPDDQSREYVSNDYQSSLSNVGLMRNEQEMKKIGKKKPNFNDSSEYLDSIQSKSIGISPSLQYNRNSNNSNEVNNIRNFQKKNHMSEKYIRNDDRIKKQGQLKRAHKYQNTKNQQQGEEMHEQQQQENENYQQEEIQQDETYNQEEQEQFSHNLVRNTPKYKQLSLHNGLQDPQSQYDSSQQKKNYHKAVFALSKNVENLQENMEAIQRKVEVLDMKVLHSHEKIQKEIIEKVESKVQEIIDRKLKRIWSVKNVLQNLQVKNYQKEKLRQTAKQEKITFKNQSQRFDYKKNLTKQFFKSDYHEQEQDQIQQQRDRTKTKRRMKQSQNQKQRVSDYAGLEGSDQFNQYNRLKTSKSIANVVNKNRQRTERQVQVTKKESHQRKNQGPNQQYIAELLEKLNTKLKERQVKLDKMHKRQQEKEKQRKSRKIEENEKLRPIIKK